MTIEKPQHTVTLDPLPPDAVSRVAFAADAATLLVSTWAGSLSLHDSTTGALKVEAKSHPHALLDAAWHHDSSSIFAASLDGSVLHACLSESAVNAWSSFGTHTAAARSLVATRADSPAGTALISGGWDAQLLAWDSRTEKALVASAEAGGKVYGAANCGPNAIIYVNSNRRVRVVDLRKFHSVLCDRAPPTLAYQLRGVSASHDGSHFVVGSTEGRAAVDWLDSSSNDPFSFRCHRLDGLAFPVNCAAHNSKYGSFATGGGDGHVAFWDAHARKRIAQYPKYPTSIASIDFDRDSNKLAIAVSYTFEEGEKDHPPDEVHVRTLEDSHIAVKSAPDNDNRQSTASNGDKQ